MAKSLRRRSQPPLGLVVEGQMEFGALPQVLRRLGIASTARNFHGQAVDQPIEALVRQRIAPEVRALIDDGIGRVMVVLDRERRATCPGQLAQHIARLLQNKALVVVADRTSENWILADPESGNSSAIVRADRRLPVRTNVDRIDALAVIKPCLERTYSKMRQGVDLLSRVRIEEPDVVGRSRSLSKFARTATSLAP